MKKVTDFKAGLASLAQQLDMLQTHYASQGEATAEMEAQFASAQQTLTELTDQAEGLGACCSYELMANHADQFISLINRDYIYEAVNDAVCRLRQKQRTEIIDHSVAELWGQELFDTEIKASLDRCFGGEVVHSRHWFHTPQATLRYFDVTCHPCCYDDQDTISHIVVVSHDITDHQVAQEQLQEAHFELAELAKRRSQSLAKISSELRYNEAKYRAVVEQTTEGMMLVDPLSLKITETNRALQQMLGYEAEELQSLTVYDVADHPKDVVNYHIKRVFEDNRHLFGEAVYLDKYGNFIPVEVSANLVTFGRFRKICVIARNIIDRKNTEKEVKAVNVRYKRLLGSVTDYIHTVEVEEGQVISTSHSPSCVAITGYEPEAFSADPNLWWRLIHTADRAMVMTHVKTIMAGVAVEPIEHRLIHRDGSLRWVRNTAVLKWDEAMNLVGYDSLITDISRRKRAELALRESETKFRTLAETTAAAIFIYQREKILYVNPAATTITGYREAELLEMDFWEVLHPDIQDRVKLQGLARQDGEDIEQRQQLKLLRKDGQTRWIDVTLGLVEYQSRCAVLGTAFDITQQKQTELERERLLQVEQQQRQRAELLSQVFLTLTSTLDMESLLDEIMTQTRQLIPCSGVNMALLAGDSLLALRWQGYDAFDVETLFVDRAQVLLDYPIDSDAIKSRQPVVVSDTQKAAHWTVQPGFEWIRAFIAMPLTFRQQTLGLLRLDGETPHQFSPEALDILPPLADAAAIAVHNAQLYDQAQNELRERMRAEARLKDLNQKLLALQYIGATIASTFEVDAILRMVSQEAQYLLNVEGCAIFEWKPHDDSISLLIKYDDRQPQNYPLAAYPTGQQVLRQRRAAQMTVSRVKNRVEAKLMEQLGLKARLMLPMESHNRVIGLFEVMERRTERIFTTDEINLAQYLANYTATALENARLYHQAQEEIAERKLVERELRHLAGKNKTLLEAIPDLMFYYDREGRVLDYKMVPDSGDLPPGFSSKTMRGQRLTEMGLPSDFVSTSLRKIGQALETGELQHYEYQLPVNQGIQDFEARIVPGGPDEVLAIIRNITPQKEAERALRRSEANLRAIFDNSHQAFILIDHEYRVQAYNKAAQLGLKLTTGRRLREGESIYQVVSAEQAKKLKQIFFAVLAGETVTLEEQHTLGLRERWFEFIYSPVSTKEGQILGICLSVLDIDERKRMTEALAEREARLLAEMQSVLITTRALATEVNITKLFQLIINQARALTQTRGAAILVLSEDNEWLEVATTDRTWLQMKPSFRLLVRGSLPELAIATQQVQVSNLDQDDERTASIRALLKSVNVNALLCAPLIAQGENLGVLLVWHKRKRSFSDNDSRLMELFADQAALAWHNAQLYTRNRELAIKQERHRLARELHDSVTQSLYSIGMAAQASLRLLPDSNNDLHEPLEHIHELSQIALIEIREQVFNLRPTALLEKGLVEVITEYSDLLSKKHDLAITFETNLSEALSLTQQEHLYYIVREALWNIVKHANAHRVEVRLSCDAEVLSLTISDDGHGFEPAAVHAGLGLSTMRERAKLLQGEMTIESRPHHGSQISVRAPLIVADSLPVTFETVDE